MTISLYKPLLKIEYLIDSLSMAGFFGINKKVVFFYFNIQLFYIMLIFCDGYKFSCENRYFRRRCALLLSITGPYYKSLFLNNLPKQLRDIVGRYAETEKLYTVGLLKNTNKLLKKEITQYFMNFLAKVFFYQGGYQSRIYLFQHQNAMNNYKKM